MTWIKNIGTWIAIAAGIALVYFKIIAGSGGKTKDIEDKIQGRRDAITKRNDELGKRKAARKRLKGKKLHSKGEDVLNG